MIILIKKQVYYILLYHKLHTNSNKSWFKYNLHKKQKHDRLVPLLDILIIMYYFKQMIKGTCMKIKPQQKILFITYGGGHANAVKYIYQKMKGDLSLTPEIIALTLAPQIFEKEDIPYHTISEYLPIFNQKDKIIETGKMLAKKAHNDSSGIAYLDSVAYLGFGFTDLCKEYGTEKARILYENSGRKCFLPIDTMKTILSFIKPDAVVVTGSPRMERAAAFAANAMGLPVIQVNDYPAEEKLQYKAKVCVMNEWERKHALTKNLIPEKQIVVTGQPVFEADLKFDQETLSKYTKAKDTINKIILYLGQGKDTVPEADDTIQTLWELSKANKNYLFIIRPHPNDFYAYPYDNTENFICSKKGKLNYLLAITDVAITHDSTAGLQAALLDKPLITVINTSIERNSLAKFGIAERISDLSQLGDTINACFDTHSRLSQKLQAGRALFKNKENATANIINVIKQEIYNKHIIN